MFKIVHVYTSYNSSRSVGLAAVVDTADNTCRILSEPEVLDLFYNGLIENPSTKKVIPNYPTDFPKEALNLSAYPTSEVFLYTKRKFMDNAIKLLSVDYIVDEDQVINMLARL